MPPENISLSKLEIYDTNGNLIDFENQTQLFNIYDDPSPNFILDNSFSFSIELDVLFPRRYLKHRHLMTHSKSKRIRKKHIKYYYNYFGGKVCDLSR